ncbi:MAG: hypothetical protein JM58_07240 [Peptococcaceae bacterium BICA1-8]|nr:MAG: hypothetical protein JM58_07240 [Peptococcaceae bacterium BICA1-8]
MGGEEFAIILPKTPLDNALAFAEKIRESVAENTFSKVGNLTISLGVAELKNDDTIDTIYKRADLALYKSKQNGRNKVEFEI